MNDASLDPIAILHALGRPGPARVTAVTGGTDTAMWRIEREGHAWALRVFRANQAGLAQREVIAMNAARACGLPIPEIAGEGTWQDRPALLMEWMPGQPLRDATTRRPWRAWTLGVSLGRTQAAIHAIPAPVVLHQHPIPWVEWATPDDALRRRLLATADPESALLHLDYHPLNVLVQGRRVTAVLDWANARGGDSRADLARSAAILRFGPLGGVLPAPVSHLVRRTLIAGWRHGYREIAGPRRDMAPFYAWAGRVMVRDLTPRLGQPDLPWLTPTFLDRVQAWTAVWRERANLSAQCAVPKRCHSEPSGEESRSRRMDVACGRDSSCVRLTHAGHSALMSIAPLARAASRQLG